MDGATFVILKSLLENSGGDLSNYYTKAEIDAMIGDISSALDTINGEVV